VDESALASFLGEGAAALHVALPDAARAALARYLRLLGRWNRTHNLTAVRKPSEMAVKHVLDSLACLPWVRGPRVLDVGSGAGLPGIVFAIAAPHLSVTLLDRSLKRALFLRQAVIELGLRNTAVRRARVEELAANEHYDTIVSRAFAELPAFLESVAHLRRAGSRIIAMKGRLPEAELNAVREQGCSPSVIPIAVPGLAGERHLVVIDT
jgi:16S rRNA (guanine527-N7)-methyltransferase